MRGKATANTALMDPQRITPAYAGKREIAAISTRQAQDHPRLCGEKDQK